MRYGSVCSGIEAATVAWEPLGWTAAFYSEIDPFPCHVLHEHYSSGRPQFMPDPAASGLKAKDRKQRAAAIKAVSRLPERANGVPNHGDMTQFDRWPDHAIDLLVGGTPCQDYSIAGLRAGMDGVRGSLTLTYAAIARRYRPRWLVWENVFGVLSSKGGRDFASLLGLLSGRRIEIPAGGWKSAGIVEGYGGAYGLAWRVFDTQYVRVDGAPRALPQRRRRVFVVGCFGGDWRRAAAVLFEREGLSGNPAPRRESGKRVAGTIASRSAGGGGLGTDFELDGGQTAVSGKPIGFDGQNLACDDQVFATLDTGAAHLNRGLHVAHVDDAARCVTAGFAQRLDWETENFVAHSLRAEGCDASEDGTGRGTPLIPIAFSMRGREGGATPEVEDGRVSPVLRPAAGGSSHTFIAFDTTQITSKENRCNPKAGDPCHPLTAGAHPPAIAHAIQAGALRENPFSGPDGVGVQEGIAYTIEARAEVQAVQTQWAVRRLTQTECARLQGFPDHHCRIPWRGKPADQCPDGPQYKAYGNSMSTNVMRWLGERIEMVEQIVAEQVSEAAE